MVQKYTSFCLILRHFSKPQKWTFINAVYTEVIGQHFKGFVFNLFLSLLFKENISTHYKMKCILQLIWQGFGIIIIIKKTITSCLVFEKVKWSGQVFWFWQTMKTLTSLIWFQSWALISSKLRKVKNMISKRAQIRN